MVLFNHATREMTAKIVYYGPGLCGKTTNLLVIYDMLDEKNRGKMLSLATKTDRTLFFDLLPVDVGKVGPFNLKIQLYTVPGQVFYNETRKLVLKGADAVVFVADSQPSMVESNRQSFDNLFENLQENQLDPNEIPIVIQFNKRDIPGVLPVEELQEKLGFEGYPYTEAAAVKGEGVMETFKLVSKITAKHLIGKLQAKPGSRPEPVRDEKKADKKKKPARAVPPPEPEPPPEAGADTIAIGATNPFADSMPFPDSPPEVSPFGSEEKDYDKAEEVSLEQLLEGRERPATFSGNVAVPVSVDDEVEDLPTDAMLSVDEPELAVAVEEAPAPYPAETETAYEPGQLSRAFPDDSAPATITPTADLEAVADLRRQVEMLREEIEMLRSEQQRLRESFSRGLLDLARQFES